MLRYLKNTFRFSELKHDQWLDSENRLAENEKEFLRWRVIAFVCSQSIRAIVFSPVTFVRLCLNLIRFLDELERLHFTPLKLMHKGEGCVVDKQTWLVNGQNIHIGNFVKISAFSSIIAGNKAVIKIGTNTIVGPGVTIVSINHGIKLDSGPIRYQEWKESPVYIGEDVWIGSNVVILPGAVVGNGCVIGAGAVIKGEVPPNSVSYLKNGKIVSVPRK